MSTITKKANGRYLARWRDPSGKQCCRTFDRKIDATNYLSTITVDTMQGRYVAPDAGRETVGVLWRPDGPTRSRGANRHGTG